MPHEELSSLLSQGDFESLFIRRMGWNNPGEQQRLPVTVEGSGLRPVAVADKLGVTAWRVDCPTGLPQRREQHLVVRRLKRLSRDQLVVFVAPHSHLWQWPEQRPSGVGYRLVDHEYRVDAPTEALLLRLAQASFTIDEEPHLTSSSVLNRVRRSFNAGKVTKAFYGEFKKHHQRFAEKIEGIAEDSRSWYTSVLLNRLMFCYFIQRKGFLDDDRNYLRNRLELVRKRQGPDQFYAFYKQFLLPLFHQGLGRADSDREYSDADTESIIGRVPYVNGGIFEPHQIEKTHHDIRIPDSAFESLFGFFDAWRWHLDERPSADGKEINPDILGYIFEQYINFTEAGQKEKGAYYTKPDVTGYMAESSILPAVADRFVEAGLDDPALLLAGSGDAFMRDSLSHGVGHPVSPPGGGGSWPWQWRSGDPAEYVELDPPGEDVALPGERWCDVVHRRERYLRQLEALSDERRTWCVDDAITENLALPELLRAYVSQLADADECRRAFEVLRSLTVCDPTVGSGAFLFAAIDVLEPLYAELLARAEELARAGAPTPEFLDEAGAHRNPGYWLIKTICLRNLFGVDLMQEAPEIAKLRLFLKLAAQIESVEDLEPLPDLDFNIKCGNLLVGIADKEDYQDRLGGTLEAAASLDEIEQLAGEVAAEYKKFVAEQAEAADADLVARKQTLNRHFDDARERCHRLLHDVRGKTDKAPFESWIESHQPFHWFVEFPSVWHDGGFDVVIGNPPYIKKSLVTDYTWFGYQTEKCPDLYALCMERATTLLNENARFAMIVMHSLCFSRNFHALREHVVGAFPALWVSSYDKRPDSLFAGSAQVRNSIVIGAKHRSVGLHTSACRRWLSQCRGYVFTNVSFLQPGPVLLSAAGKCVWPFVDSPEVVAAFAKMSNHKAIGDSLAAGVTEGHRLYFKNVAHYMLGAYVDQPSIVTLDGMTSTSPHDRVMAFKVETQRDVAVLTYSGRWGYLWWLIFSDQFHVTLGTLAAFPGDIERLCRDQPAGGVPEASSDMELIDSLVGLSRELQQEMPDHLAWQKNAGVRVGRYNMAKLRHITDKADWLLARAWGIEDAFEAAGNLRDRMVFGNKE